LEVPIVSIGVYRADTPKVVEKALDMGITHIDCARKYSDGKTEEVLGLLLKKRKRDSFIIATKADPSLGN